MYAPAVVRSLIAPGFYYVHGYGIMTDDSFGNLVTVPEYLLHSWFTWDEDMLRYS